MNEQDSERQDHHVEARTEGLVDQIRLNQGRLEIRDEALIPSLTGMHSPNAGAHGSTKVFDMPLEVLEGTGQRVKRRGKTMYVSLFIRRVALLFLASRLYLLRVVSLVRSGRAHVQRGFQNRRRL